jgi:thiol:disulfide interchange protein DsbC
MGTELYYASNDGKYIIQGGSLIDLDRRVDLSEERLKGIRLGMLSKVDQKDEIIFPASKERHVITVFTDIDCGYCRKLHKQIKDYNARGISVHYLSFPRSGVNTPSFFKAEAVWCSKDRKDALTRAKAGETLPPGKCDNPVRTEMELGEQLGVNGTPAIFLEDGTLLPGYIPPARLAAELDRLKSM